MIIRIFTVHFVENSSIKVENFWVLFESSTGALFEKLLVRTFIFESNKQSNHSDEQMSFKELSGIGQGIICSARKDLGTNIRRYRSMFDVSSLVCSNLYENFLRSTIVQPIYCVIFLFLCIPEHGFCAMTKMDDKTMRKWVWTRVEVLAIIKLITLHYTITFSLLHTHFFQKSLP